MRACWCGFENLTAFSQEYSVCSECGTLVSQQSLADDQLLVKNDDTDFYGKQYWLGHQSDDLGFPDIYKRARNDLTERNLHWLKTLLKYRLPPAKVLELGCSHGSFVALLREAGYDASGVEMSPWVVEFGQKSFGALISIGPVEVLEIAPGSLDVIALMDVLEHLPDPVATMAHCLKLLKPDGLLLIQTPQFKEGMSYEALVESKNRFLEMLIPEEHIYLFSDRSVTRLFQQLGAEHIQFEPAIFGHYDMFFVVSRTPLKTNTPEQTDSTLLATPSGKFSLALLDLRERELNLIRKLAESESDYAVQCEQIKTLTAMLKESDADRAARGEQIKTLTEMVKESEAVRGEQIETLTKMVKESEAARDEQIETLTRMVKESETDRAARGEQIETLTRMVKESEADRAARGEQIETLTRMVKESEADRAAQGELIESLKADLRALFARPGFRLLTKYSNWLEVKKLAKQIGLPNE